MKARSYILILLGLCLIGFRLGCGPDRGKCLQSHQERQYKAPSWEYTYSYRLQYDGKFAPSWGMDYNPGYDYELTVCDLWESPNGRMEKDEK